MSQKPFVEKRFTDDEIYRANTYDLLEIASSYGLTVKHYSRGTYTTVEHDSLKMTPSENKWVWKSQNKGGGPIQFKMLLGNLSWVEAVNALLGTEPEINHSVEKIKIVPKPKKEFALPPQSDNFKHLYAYLTKTRGIHADVLTDFVKDKSIYESIYIDEEKGYRFSNCTFVGKDKEGVPKYAAVRSTNSNVSFKGEIEGSDKEYAFSRRGSDTSLFAFESPIEMLSFLTLLKNKGNKHFDSHMIANGGVSLLAMHRYLDDYKVDNIEDIYVCTNNDEAGHNSYLKVLDEFGDNYNIHRLKSESFDWNNDLTLSLQMETKHKQFKLPINPMNMKYDVLYSFLVDTMKIDKDLVDRLISEKLLHQTIFNNCAFAGKDFNGNIRSSFIVSTNLIGENFENYTEGSDTRIPFSITGENSSVCVFKDPLEMLSYLSLVKHHNVEKFNNHCISYGHDVDAVVNYLEMNPKIKNVILCMNEDQQYEVTSKMIKVALDNVTFKVHQPKSHSFNDDLNYLLSSENENGHDP